MLDKTALLMRLEAMPAGTQRLSVDELREIDRAIDAAVNDIARQPSFEAANNLLWQFADLHLLLSQLFFKYHITPSKRHLAIIRSFDRHDVLSERNRIFVEIKSGLFPWHSTASE